MKTPEAPEPTRERDVLAAIDRALAAGRPQAEEPALRELEQLAVDLRDETPVAPSELRERLDRRLAEGFPRRRHSSRRLGGTAAGGAGGPARGPLGARGRRLLPRPALAGATAFAVLLALAVAVPVVTEVPPDTGGEPSTLSEEAVPPRSRSAPGSTTIAPDPGGGDFAAGRRDRRVQRSASISLAAPEERLEAVGDAIVAVADRHRGFVLTSSLGAGGSSSAGGGSFELRVPVAELRPVLRELSALGEVRQRSETSREVTASVATAEERLEVAQSERRGLLRRLERAESDASRRALRRQLELVSAQIRSTRAELRRIGEQADYAAVSVSLFAEGAEPAAGGPITEAWSDLEDTLVAALSLGLRTLGFLLPLAALGVPAALAWRALRRRARESALR
jgi:hypothetical protein